MCSSQRLRGAYCALMSSINETLIKMMSFDFKCVSHINRVNWRKINNLLTTATARLLTNITTETWLLCSKLKWFLNWEWSGKWLFMVRPLSTNSLPVLAWPLPFFFLPHLKLNVTKYHKARPVPNYQVIKHSSNPNTLYNITPASHTEVLGLSLSGATYCT